MPKLRKDTAYRTRKRGLQVGNGCGGQDETGCEDHGDYRSKGKSAPGAAQQKVSAFVRGRTETLRPKSYFWGIAIIFIKPWGISRYSMLGTTNYSLCGYI